jgi:hypothetical protein
MTPKQRNALIHWADILVWWFFAVGAALLAGYIVLAGDWLK